MKNSLRQVFRTPIKTGLFCVIFIFGTMLFTVGLNLWLGVSEKIKAADETFVTIGTVRQKEQSTAMEGQWDAGLKDYIYQETQVYGEFLDTEFLESLHVEYISGRSSVRILARHLRTSLPEGSLRGRMRPAVPWRKSGLWRTACPRGR